MKGTRFDELKSFPKIFLDFLYSNSKINDRYTHIADGNTNFSGDTINELIKSSEKTSDIYNENIQFSYTLVKPASFGGSLTDIYKIISLINFSKSKNSIPLVIIDDDDFISKNTYSTYIYDEKLIPYELSLINNTSDNNFRFDFEKITGSIEINEADDKFNNDFINFEHDNGTADFYKEIYRSDIKLTDAYINFLKSIFPESGLLYLTFSDLRKHNSGKETKMNIVSSNKEITEGIKYAVNVMESRGYQIQPKEFDINLYKLTDNIKTKIHVDEIKNISNILELDHTIFTPTVMLKNILIEQIFPVKSVVLSPSEISYFSLLKEIYKLFYLSMPEIIPRYSFTLNDKAIMEELHSRHLDHKLFEFIFPLGDYQERIISPLYFIYLFGRNVFSELCKSAYEYVPDQHYTLNI